GAGWQRSGGSAIPRLENDVFLVEADPARGGTLTRVVDKRSGTDLLQPGGGGNELVLQPEHPAHPRWAEGPWLLCPAGPGIGTTTKTASIRVERCPIGGRVVAELELAGLSITQETLLWDGADRVEFRTHVDGSIGQDHLLRVVFPVDVPGGLPVYQTAVAVVGRPPGPIDTDVAEHAYTLDSPANEWLAIGATAAVAVTGPDGSRQQQAIGVAEVVASSAQREPARALLAALAGQGVTATCSLPGAPRYGYQELDSNLPDFRICLGGPADNELTARVLAAAGPAAAAAVDAQLAAVGVARLWVPAARSRADAFEAGADVRGTLDLPVLIVAAVDLPAEVNRLAADLGDAVIEADTVTDGWAGNGAGGAGTTLAPHTVALLNRGTPSGLVTPDGQLTMALMRACSTWPCGVWIDGKKRTSPDGTSFAWQHWSHTFEYALAGGAGTWRTAGFATAGQDYNHDLLTTATGLHGGSLPATTRLASVGPPGALLSALKPHGNPLAPGTQPAVADGVTVRLRDVGGAGPVEARVSLFPGLTSAAATGLCEDGPGEPVPIVGSAAVVTVPRAGLTTLVVTTPASQPARREAPADSMEPAQPVYARYWLHGKGPAPAGNLPVAVHLSPATVRLDHGQPGALRLTVACGPAPAAGVVRLDVPGDITVAPAGPLRYDLQPLEYQAFDLTAAAQPDAGPGRWFVAASIEEPSGQVVEDSALLSIGQPPEPRLDLPLPEVLAMQQAAETAQAGEADVSVLSPALAIRPGRADAIEVLVRNRTDAAIRGEAQLVSPFGSWQQTAPWTTGFALAAGQERTLRFEVRIPATARAGEQWWAIVKVMYFGRLQYTEPVEVTIV
ncbi:MAG TPA: glycoside hydrolase family 38 C-terminal domain-containing protein, partial [Streptosporangiaceae bacterium]|nr:glycoside hydrolase family 38 C-terminal domain-containing protein [Streptosporangiaceae bacterium]